jgi:hypothetical protein
MRRRIAEPIIRQSAIVLSFGLWRSVPLPLNEESSVQPGRQFFHGTRNAFLEPGDEIVPASESGSTQSWIGYTRFPTVELKERGGARTPVARKDKVFTTSVEDEAWDFSEQIIEKESPSDRAANKQTGGRPYVYEVEPVNPKLPVHPHATGEVVSDRAKVLRRIDIPPGQKPTMTFDEWGHGTPSEGTEFNPEGWREGRSHARQGELPGRGINWQNYNEDAWYGNSEWEHEEPSIGAEVKAFTGQTPTELDTKHDQRWREAHERRQNVGQQFSPLEPDPRQGRLF